LDIDHFSFLSLTGAGDYRASPFHENEKWKMANIPAPLRTQEVDFCEAASQ